MFYIWSLNDTRKKEIENLRNLFKGNVLRLYKLKLKQEINAFGSPVSKTDILKIIAYTNNKDFTELFDFFLYQHYPFCGSDIPFSGRFMFQTSRDESWKKVHLIPKNSNCHDIPTFLIHFGTLNEK